MWTPFGTVDFNSDECADELWSHEAASAPAATVPVLIAPESSGYNPFAGGTPPSFSTSPTALTALKAAQRAQRKEAKAARRRARTEQRMQGIEKRHDAEGTAKGGLTAAAAAATHNDASGETHEQTTESETSESTAGAAVAALSDSLLENLFGAAMLQSTTGKDGSRSKSQSTNRNHNPSTSTNLRRRTNSGAELEGVAATPQHGRADGSAPQSPLSPLCVAQSAATMPAAQLQLDAESDVHGAVLFSSAPAVRDPLPPFVLEASSPPDSAIALQLFPDEQQPSAVSGGLQPAAVSDGLQPAAVSDGLHSHHSLQASSSSLSASFQQQQQQQHSVHTTVSAEYPPHLHYPSHTHPQYPSHTHPQLRPAQHSSETPFSAFAVAFEDELDPAAAHEVDDEIQLDFDEEAFEAAFANATVFDAAFDATFDAALARSHSDQLSPQLRVHSHSHSHSQVYSPSPSRSHSHGNAHTRSRSTSNSSSTRPDADAAASAHRQSAPEPRSGTCFDDPSHAQPTVSAEPPSEVYAHLPPMKVCRALPKDWTRRVGRKTKKKLRKRRAHGAHSSHSGSSSQAGSPRVSGGAGCSDEVPSSALQQRLSDDGANRTAAAAASGQPAALRSPRKLPRSKSFGDKLRQRKQRRREKKQLKLQLQQQQQQVHAQHQQAHPHEQSPDGSTASSSSSAVVATRQRKSLSGNDAIHGTLEMDSAPTSAYTGSSSSGGSSSASVVTGGFAALPPAVLHEIALYMGVRTLCRMARVCRAWREAINSSNAWQVVYERHFGATTWLHVGPGPALWTQPYSVHDWRVLIRSRCEEQRARRKLDSGRAHSTAVSSQVASIYVDVVEKLRVQFSVNGRASSGMVSGKIICRAVTPTPSKCVLHFNDPYASVDAPVSCHLDEMVFHDCVDRNSLIKHRGRLVFAPPGALNFHLMRYRKLQPNLDDLPLQLRPSYIYDRDRGVLQVTVELDSCYKAEYTASNLRVVIPLPALCLPRKSDIKHSKGKVKPSKTENAVMWKLNKLHGSSPVTTTFEVPVSVARYDAWDRPPVLLELDPVYGIQFTNFRVRMLKVYLSRGGRFITQPDRYAQKWVRSMSIYDSFEHAI